MCLACLNTHFITFKLLGEYIFVDFENKEPKTHEVYDFFFESPEDIASTDLILISPHDLINKGALAVKSALVIGADDKHEIVYHHRPGQKGASFNEEKNEAQVSIAYIDRPSFMPDIHIMRGKMLIPDIEPIPGFERPEMQDLMMKAGTVFKVNLKDLVKGKDYAFRLIITPSNFNGIPKRRDISGLLETIKTHWEQNSVVYSTFDCVMHYIRCLEKAHDAQTDFAEPATSVGALVKNPQLLLARVEIHRICIILPDNCSIKRHETGLIEFIDSRPSDNETMISEWVGGINTYWIDDIFLTAKKTYQYLSEWSKDGPKTKEAISVALKAPPESINLVVDILVKKSALNVADPSKGTYTAINGLAPDYVNKLFCAAAMDPEVIKNFGKMGYTIDFSYSYQYVSEKDSVKLTFEKKEKETEKRRSKNAFRLGIISLSIGIISFLITVGRWVFAK